MPDPNEPDVVIDNSEPEDSESVSQVVVDLEKKPVEKLVEKQDEKPVDVKDSKPELARLNNTIAYQTRKLEQAMRELDEMKRQFARPTVQKVSQDDTKDEIDELAERDWKLGVKKVVEPEIESRVNAAFEKRDLAQRELLRKSALDTELERSKRKVLDKYPEIEDETTETSAIYRQVMNEDNSILSNIHGPEIAMYRMEERMRQMGKTPASVKPIVDREVNRLTRAGASSAIGRMSSQNGKITLSKEQKEFCDHYKIPYEQYAKNLKAETAGGVEL